MSSETATCPGCDQIFSLRGYQRHLALTRDPLCRAVFDNLKLKKANDGYMSNMTAEENSTPPGSESSDAVLLFQGDAFGAAEDYTPDTFGQQDDDEVDAGGPPPLMDISDDEGDDEDDEDLEVAEMVAELEKSWEPPREGAPHQDAMDDEVDADDPPHLDVPNNVNDDEGHIQPEREVDQFIIGDGYGVKPAVKIRYNDRHPSARAGQPLTQEESRDHAYSAALGGGDNPWAPFNSKKDWEIARWAKLRGSGLTAFSELLAIDGVRFN